MAEIVPISRLAQVIKTLKRQKGKVVLAGGCFDVLHSGHVIFLEKAKGAGACLVVFLESDEKIKILKGIDRPIYPQGKRAQALAALKSIDYIVLLPFFKTDLEYDKLVGKIKPDVIAVTAGKTDISHHQRVARAIGAKLQYVTKELNGYSTTSLIGSVTVQ